MAHPILSKRKSNSLSFVLFLAALALITYFKYWWPGIMLTIGIPLALKQYLLGKIFDMIVSLIVFLGVFITVQFSIQWEYVLPILFTLGGFYVFFREFFGPKEIEEEDIEEDRNKEIEEEEEEKKH